MRIVHFLAKICLPEKDLYFYFMMKMAEEHHKNTEIYLAPLQGFTDAVYRKAYNEIFSGIDAYFIPYISVKNNQIIKKYEREILRENNPQLRVIPQVLAKNTDELLFLATHLEQEGYSEINLNLGCPYPMVTNRGKGAGLLPHPEKLDKMLEAYFRKSNPHLSIKMRAGLNSTEELGKVIAVLDNFPVSEIILHPRIAQQLYAGPIFEEAFKFASQNTNHKFAYNGDIFSVADFNRTKMLFPEISAFMIGRGVLQNPFLPGELKNEKFSDSEKDMKLANFHQLILKYYSEWMDNEGNVLNKMKQFWIYFGANFNDHEKRLKQIKKTRSLSEYTVEITRLFQSKN